MSNATNPCDEAIRLRSILTSIVSGEHASMVRDGEDEVRFSSANVDELRRLIAEQDDLCRQATDGPRRRRRYGIVGRSRPY